MHWKNRLQGNKHPAKTTSAQLREIAVRVRAVADALDRVAEQMEAASVESLPKPSNCNVEYRITENVLPSSIHGELAWLGSRDVSPLKHWNNANS